MPEHQFEEGDRVRVRTDCPHTLPAYARMLEGVVLGRTADGMYDVRFGEERQFPIPPECLVPSTGPAADAEADEEDEDYEDEDDDYDDDED